MGVYSFCSLQLVRDNKKTSACPKEPSSRTNRGLLRLEARHVSLTLMPYRRAKSLLLSLYMSVLMPLTSSTTVLPVSLSR